MKNIKVPISEPVLKQAEELAERENISVEELIGLAATQTIGVWSTELHLSLQDNEAGREKFLAALTKSLELEELAQPSRF